MGRILAGHASNVTYEALFAKTRDNSFANKLCKDMEQVQFRRIVISSPRDNMTEAFKFSSRHSEFVCLKAEALITTTTSNTTNGTEGATTNSTQTSNSSAAAASVSTAPLVSADDDWRRYKVVLQYPDKSSTYTML